MKPTAWHDTIYVSRCPPLRRVHVFWILLRFFIVRNSLKQIKPVARYDTACFQGAFQLCTDIICFLFSHTANTAMLYNIISAWCMHSIIWCTCGSRPYPICGHSIIWRANGLRLCLPSSVPVVILILYIILMVCGYVPARIMYHTFTDVPLFILCSPFIIIVFLGVVCLVSDSLTP